MQAHADRSCGVASTSAPHAAQSSSRRRRGVAAGAGARGKRAPQKPPKPSSKQRGPPQVVVGIDLGTTNSAVAWLGGGSVKPRCIPNAEGSTVTPSVVAFLPGGEVKVGTDARREGVRHAQTTYSSTKRLIGRRADDPVVQQEQARLPYKVLSGEQGEVCLACESVGRGFIYPEEVSAQILVQLLDDAEAYTGGEVRKAIISVPAYFNTAQREATANAGALAGLDVVRLIREPVAAALAYGLDLKEDQTVLVFDLGGGTFDISLLEVGNGTIEVLSTGGDPYLGGDDWDGVIVDWLVKKHLKAGPARGSAGSGGTGTGGVDLADARVRANLRALAEAAKLGLSSSEEVTLRMPIGGPGGGPLEVQLTRVQLEQMSEKLWKRCRLPLDAACWAAGVDLNAALAEADEKREELIKRGVPLWKTQAIAPAIAPRARPPLSKVLLVGGATRMPAVAQFIRNMTGLEPVQGVVDPDEAVALGAAVQAGVLQGEVKDLMVMDQWQASLMRALAQLKMAQDPEARAAMERQFEFGNAAEDDEETRRQERAILDKLEEEYAAEAAAQEARAALEVQDSDGADKDSLPVPSEGKARKGRALGTKRRVVRLRKGGL